MLYKKIDIYSVFLSLLLLANVCIVPPMQKKALKKLILSAFIHHSIYINYIHTIPMHLDELIYTTFVQYSDEISFVFLLHQVQYMNQLF